MAEEQSITKQLSRHCLEDLFYLQVLLNTGALPEGWATKYLELLAIAKAQYAERTTWPREFVAAAYCVSVYCPKRYKDWQDLTGGSNLETEQVMRKVRWVADDLMFSGSIDLSDGPADLTTGCTQTSDHTDDPKHQTAKEPRDMNTEPVIVEQIYNVPIATVWKAITDKDQMRQWYFEPMTEFKPEVGFETQFDVECEGLVFPHQWKVTEVVPETRIVYDWRYGGYPGDSSVTWELSETPEGAKLKLTHSGHENLLQDVPGFGREACQAGWCYFLHESLKAFLERQDP